MAFEISYQQKILANGFRIIHASVPWSRTFAATLTFEVGRRDETKKCEGITHFLEHLAFHGDNLKLAKILSRKGIFVNASTEWEHTLFTTAGHANYLSDSLDFLTNILTEPSINPTNMRQELEILNHELAMNAETPVDLEMRRIAASIIGDREFSRVSPKTVKNLSRLAPEEITEYRHNWYTASNAFLAIVSPLKAEDIFTTIEDKFGHYPKYSVKRPTQRTTKKPRLQRLIVRHFSGSHVMVQVFHTMSPIEQHKLPVLSMLADLNGGEPHGHLFQEIRQKRQMGYQTGSDFTILNDFMIFSSFAIVHKRFTCPTLEQILETVIMLRQIDRSTYYETQESFINSLDILEDSPIELCSFITNANIRSGIQSLFTPAQYRIELQNLSYEKFTNIANEIFHPERLVVALFGEVGIFKKWKANRIIREYQENYLKK